MRRNNQNIGCIWFHLDTTHIDYATAIADMESMHESQGPILLSINLKDDGTESMVKVLGIHSKWYLNKTWINAVINIYTYKNIDEILSIVNDPSWLPEE